MLDLTNLFSVQDRVAVVTGASSGLGERFVDVLSASGCRVVLAARRMDRITDHVERLRADGKPALAVRCDVTRDADIARLMAGAIESFGGLDILVNNAGIAGHAMTDEAPEDFRRVLEVNLTGLYQCARRAGAIMLEREGGSIINISSISGLAATDGADTPSYAASKAGVINLTRELAVRWAARGVRVNSIAPGYFPTEMTAEDLSDESTVEFIHSRTPMGREGRLTELDGALLFLASDASSYVTGHTLVVDGGWSAR